MPVTFSSISLSDMPRRVSCNLVSGKVWSAYLLMTVASLLRQLLLVSVDSNHRPGLALPTISCPQLGFNAVGFPDQDWDVGVVVLHGWVCSSQECPAVLVNIYRCSRRRTSHLIASLPEPDGLKWNLNSRRPCVNAYLVAILAGDDFEGVAFQR